MGSLGQEDPLEEGMATHSSIPAWRIPCGMPDVRMGRDTCHMHRASVRGRKFFHSKCISWS